MGDEKETREGYDRVSDEYAARFRDELSHKPFDREVLAELAEELRAAGPVADVGCGPGQIAAHLHAAGVDVRGIDLSPGMIEQARSLFPDVDFSVGDMRDLPLRKSSLAGITAFYSIIHLSHEDVPVAFAEFHRVLRPGGLLLLAFHLGDKVETLDEWWGRKVSIDFVFFERKEIEDRLLAAGFEIIEARERDPYPVVEAQTRRAYVLAARRG